MDLTTILTIGVVVVVFIVLFKVFKLVLRLVLFGIFLIIAYYTNPDTEQHTRAVVEKAERTDVDLKGKNIVVDDYYVFSLTNIVDNAGSRVVGAGAFTQVVIFSKP